MELIEHFGWPDCIKLANESVELITTTSVGPRILSYRRQESTNIFKTYTNQLGSSAEPDWQIRGGHRLWVAPESEATYFADNYPVDYRENDDGSVSLVAPPESDNGYQKSMRLSLRNNSSEVIIEHKLLALEDQVVPLALWTLSVMKPGGIAKVPLPEHIPHPSDVESDNLDKTALLPNQQIALWPYSNLADPRMVVVGDEVMVYQQDGKPSFKIGFAHQQEQVFYDCNGERFSKSIAWDPVVTYPDCGCNLEIYTNGEMLELEALGPLTTLKAGESIRLSETWSLESI